MRVLFDKNVPHGVREFLGKHQIETVDERGWQRVSNGKLLETAEAAGFEVILTADQNIVYQQNLKNRKIALVVLGSNIWPLVQNHRETIAERVDAATPGSYTMIEIRMANKGK